MKSLKRAASLLLAFAFVLFTMAPAFASGTSGDTEKKIENQADGGYSITIQNAIKDETYAAYQIFSGKLAKETGGNYILSDIEWGSGINATKKIGDGDAAKDIYQALADAGFSIKNDAGEDVPYSSAREVAEALSAAVETVDNATEPPEAGKTAGFDNAKAQAFAKAIAPYLVKPAPENHTATTVMTGETGTAKIEGLDAGYYLVETTNIEEGATDTAYTRYMLEVVADVTAKAKSDIPSVEKKVDDLNDSNDKEIGPKWEDSADYDIGDSVPFQLTGKLPSNYADYKTYKYVFHDTESAGLTFNASTVKVTIDGREIAETAYSVVTPGEDGCTFDIVFNDLKQITTDAEEEPLTITKDSVIVVTYSSRLNEGAVIGNPGNPNTVHLEYSNNPNQDGTGTPDTGNTPDDTVVVFTFEIDVNKVDAERNELEGAGFTLYKWIVPVDPINHEPTGNGYWGLVETITGETTFEFEGLDDGFYKLEETTVPAGYNKAEDVLFEVEATHTLDTVTGKDQVSKLTIYKAEEKDGIPQRMEGEDPVDTNFTPLMTRVGDETEDQDHKAGYETEIMNQQGAQLPETGGIGTTIFYVVGGVLVVGAVVLLVTKKRMNN